MNEISKKDSHARIISKVHLEYLKDDPTLTEKRTLAELECTQAGIYDSSLEEAYASHKKVLEENLEITPKGYLGYLKDDPTLKKKRTFAELEDTQVGIDDSSLEQAYDGYKKVMKKINKVPYQKK